jgi:hypothetical protein
MKKRLLNVRLDEEHVRKVEALRRQGVTLSDLVREAIDARYAASATREREFDAKRLTDELFDLYPDPADLPPREYDVADRRAARAAIRRKLQGRGR